jgi:hypothetical protein
VIVKNYIYPVILISFIFSVQSIRAQCFNGNNAFQEGEYASYDISYNWGPVWVNAGVVTFEVLKEQFNGKMTLHLKSTGKTFSSYDLLFKVRDYYDSWISTDSFQTQEFRRMIYEGGWQTVNSLRFNNDRSLVFSSTKNNNSPIRYDTLKPGPCAFDLVSAVYYARTLDLSHLNADSKIPVKVMIDDGVYSIYIKSLGREVVETKKGEKYRCIKFTARMIQGTIFRGDEDMLVWVTDDENKVPVYIEAKILVGTIKAYLKDFKGLKNPRTSLLK